MSIPRNDRSGFYHYESGACKILGRFQIVAGPVMGPWVGRGFTPTRVGVGDYLITLTDAFAQIVSVQATCQVALNNVDLYAQIGTITPGAAPAVQIQTKAIAADTEVTANDWVNFEITVRSEWT
ncbi:MAG: hypothetical protein ACXABY_07840 [Candidatus Thorarchaeota archaeon]|jgi:hypothetical protein